MTRITGVSYETDSPKQTKPLARTLKVTYNQRGIKTSITYGGRRVKVKFHKPTVSRRRR